jgi:hypothetical protein
VTKQLDLNTVLKVDSVLTSQTKRFTILTKLRKKSKLRAKRTYYSSVRHRVEPYPLDSSITLILDKSEYVALLYLSLQPACLVIQLLPSPERANSLL